jgi:hypothetical protein
MDVYWIVTIPHYLSYYVLLSLFSRQVVIGITNQEMEWKLLTA